MHGPESSILALAALTALSAPARADVVYESAERSISTTLGPAAEVHTRSRSGDGGWVDFLYFEYTDADHDPRQPSWARADQQSFMLDGPAASIRAVGGVGGFDGSPGDSGIGRGESFLTAVFILDGPTPATLMVDASIAGPLASFSISLLSTPTGSPPEPIFYFDPALGPPVHTWADTLPAGRYTFSARFISGGAGPGTSGGSGMYNYILAVPSPFTLAIILLPLSNRRRAMPAA